MNGLVRSSGPSLIPFTKTLRLWLLAGFALFAAGCLVEEDLSTRPEYKEMVGQVFETKVDLLLYADDELGGINKVSVAVPGTSRRAPALADLPAEFPYSFEGELVLGILPAGSMFTVNGVRKSSNKLEGYVFKGFRAKLLSPAKYGGRELDVIALTGDSATLNFKPGLVSEYLPAGEVAGK